MYRQEGLLWCGHCKQYLLPMCFNSSSAENSNYGHLYKCKACLRARRQQYKQHIDRYNTTRNTALKAKYVALLGGCCQRCGYAEYNAALDFHHIDPAIKTASAMQVVYSGNHEAACAELDKCCLLCSNCHRAYEARMWDAEFVHRDGQLGYSIGAVYDEQCVL